MIDVLLISHLLIQDNEFSLYLSTLGKLRVESVLYFNYFDLLNGRGIFLQLLRYLLDDLYLLLDLYRL